MPQVIVIDEIGTELEALAAGTIAQRGVQLVGTAHGMTVENLIKNPSLQMLAGGIQVCSCYKKLVRRCTGWQLSVALAGVSIFRTWFGTAKHFKRVYSWRSFRIRSSFKDIISKRFCDSS